MTKLTLKSPLSPETQEELAGLTSPPVQLPSPPVEENKTKAGKPSKPPNPPRKAAKVARTPEEIASLQQANREEARKAFEAVKLWLQETFLQAFDFKSPRPLKTGIHIDLLNRKAPFSRTRIRKVLGVYVNSPGYLKALMSGQCRYGLDGEQVEEILPEQKAWAENRLISRKPRSDKNNV